MLFVPDGQYQVEVESMDERHVWHTWENVADPRYVINAEYFDGGILRELTYKFDGKEHREGGPASISFNGDGTRPMCQTWYRHGKVHRVDGPAEIEHDDQTGALVYEAFGQDGQYHREGGPAIIRYDLNGKIKSQEFYRHGREIPAFTPDQPDNTMG